MIRSGALALLVSISIPFLRADQIIAKNGDRITGSIVKKDGKKLTIKSEIFGTVTLPWDQVESIRTDEPVTVEFSSGVSIEGPVTVSGDVLEIEGPDRPERVSVAEVVAVRGSDAQREYERLLDPAWTDLWAGTAIIGLSGAQGNAQTLTLSTGVDAARISRTDKTTLYFKAVRASALVDGVEAATAEAVRGGWAYDRNASDRWFLTSFNDYESDRFQNLDLRFVIGGGLGFIPWRSERGRLDVVAGGAYNHESFFATEAAPATTRSSGEAYFGDEFTLKMNSVTSIFQKLRLFPNVSNLGEYRLNVDLGADTKLTKWLSWSLSISNRFLSNPVSGRQKNDVLYTTGLGISFALNK